MTALTLWLIVAALAVAPRGDAPLTVSAAVSLTDALTEIAEAYRQAGGARVRFNFAASNVLARQIVNGAPVDVFISADAAQMDAVQRAGRIDPATRFDVLTNRLAVLVRAGMTVPVRDARDLADRRIRRIAMGSPDGVPAGIYAREWLETAGVWRDLQRRIVPMGSVRAALAAVENGSVDVAIVYRSDTLRARAASVAFVVAAEAPRITYPAAVLNRTAQRSEATRFLSFLRDERARGILSRHGFPGIAR